MSMTGPDPEHPTKVGVPIGDLLAGMYGAYEALGALHERQRTGRGRVVRTSLLASVAPYGLFRTADTPIQVAVGSEAQWGRFATVAGLDVVDERSSSNERQVAHRADLIDEIEDAFAAEDAESWLARRADGSAP